MKFNTFILCVSCWSWTSGDVAEAVCQANPASTQNDNTSAKQKQTRDLILKFFPHLDKDSVDGWVDSYSSMTESELTQLLQQRKMLGVGGTGFSGLQLDLPNFQIDAPTTNDSSQDTRTLATPISRAIRMVNANIFGSHIAGHRCQTFYFTHAESLGENIGALEIQESWNFSEGRIQQSGRHLDVSIKANSLTMFRLEPGCVLTRAGHFVRLPDGRLGQKVGSKHLALFPEIRVPDSEGNVRIASDGSVYDTQSRTRQSPLGRITAVKVIDEARLKSTNGIYFSVPKEARSSAFEPAQEIMLEPRTVELSNVDIAQQRQLLERLQAMSGFLQFGQ